MSLVSTFDLKCALRLLDEPPALAPNEREVLEAFLDAGTCPNTVHDDVREQAALILVERIGIGKE